MNRLRSIDLFAGIGGIRLGFDRAFGDSIDTVFVCEWDENAQKTYKANFNDNFAIAGDITKIDEKDVPEFDICLAGFPCQAFSLAGQRMGFEDNYKGMCRGTLFMDVARICEYHKPKVIFCENVKGLVIHDRGRTFKIICKTFEDLGYKVFHKVLNSKNFGVPQNRERIYIVAFRNDVAPEKFIFPEITDDTKRLHDIREENSVPAKYYLSDVYVETLRKHKARHESKGNGFGYEIRDWSDIAGAIVCGGMGRERNLVIDKRQKNLTPTTHIKGNINKEGIRKMTPREWARLQGFPDSFDLPLADTHLYKQFGNSVTVNVIEAIAKEIKKVLDAHSKNGTPPATQKRTSGTSILKKYLEEHVGEEIPLDTLNTICGDAGLHHWDRVIRNLIQQEGYDIENKKGEWYKLRSLTRKPVKSKRSYISKKLKYMVFERDNFTCQACGKTIRDDKIKLSPDHIIPVDWGGETTLDNLQALCTECNEGKQAWVDGEDNAIMRKVSLQTSAKMRLKVYFESHPNEEISVDRLSVVAKTREWTRSIRYLRSEYELNIEYRPTNKSANRLTDVYIYLKEE